MEQKASYIKENDPKAYQFFLGYWKYLKTYYVMTEEDCENNDWWGCFMSDMCYYVNRYEYNKFYVDLIMALYIRNLGGSQKQDIHYLSSFYKEWWEVLNQFYVSIKGDSAKQGEFVERIQQLYEKYSKDSFFNNCIDILYEYVMPEIKTEDSIRFVKYIYNLV